MTAKLVLGYRRLMDTWVLSKHAAAVVAERAIRLEWIGLALDHPDAVVGDLFDRSLSHALRSIAEADYRVLHVVYNGTMSPRVIVTAFFDRRERRRREGHFR
ncbi:MAG: DUF4258 domain-containing protein [Thermoleophilia bacterium]|nr:DUF4258 domain-containing protein [Thermoleophilia bacterium]